MSDDINTTEIDESANPDEEGSFLIESHVKIFDPETEEVFVNQR